ncbi:MAG: DUF120 domain-containing protein [Thermoplasmata archaeon]|nr:DUF120 domain-containing protein [Thermoplasmata archaeon]
MAAVRATPRKPKAEEVRVLRLLAGLGAARAPVDLSSRELGERLEMSQQQADRYLLALEKRGWVTRRLAARRQRLSVTPLGWETLRAEYHALRRLFEGPSRLRVSGAVTSGLGEGRYYLSQPGYVVQFAERLGYKPYPGTLNVRVRPDDLAAVGAVRDWTGTRIDGFQAGGRTFGGATCFVARIGGKSCHLIVPDRSHYQDVIELIAPDSLRDSMHLKDTDPVEVEIEEA